MWGSQGWNQWALQPAMFNDVPHEQIDWAELAKQWIQMQQAQPSDSPPLVPPLLPPASLHPPPPPPPGHEPLMSEEFPESNIVPLLKTPVLPSVMPEQFHSGSAFENEPVQFVPKTTDNNSFWSKPHWEASIPNDVDERLWVPPPVEPATPILPGKETFDYGHVHDNPPLAMQSIDYNHMSEFSYNQMYPTPAPEAPYEQYWSQVNATPTISPIFLKKERSSANLPVEEETTQLDAAKRKQLPAWIRDGLEKMEQERLKRLEKERAAKENAQQMAKMDFLKSSLDFKDGTSTTLPFTKSKFDSDSDVEEIETVEKKSISPVLKRTPSPTEDTRTQEERKEELMLKVRRMLTEILLSVTNSEMVDIAQEVYRKAISKAPARQLATASSLNSVASGLRGLASYGTESEASDQEEEDGSDSEEELYRKIKEKKRLFAQKEKRIIAELERKEHEEKIEAEREKTSYDKNSEKKPSKDFYTTENLEDPSDSMSDKNSNTHMQSAEHNSQAEPSSFSVKIEEMEENSKSNKIEIEMLKPVAENIQPEKAESESYDSEESNSSGFTSESGGKSKKILHKETKMPKSELKKLRKDKSSSKHSSRRRRSKSRDSGSSEKQRRERSRERKSSSSKKKKKYRESDSGDSSSSSSRRRKHSSRYESTRSHRKRRSHSYDDQERRRKRSVSSSRFHSKSDHRSYRSHRYSDDKYDRKYKDEKKYYDYDYRHSPSPHGYSSRLPRKYRSRSLSSESQSSGKKLKKYRNR